jgi:hypothetical protein
MRICNLGINWRLSVSSYYGYLMNSEVACGYLMSSEEACQYLMSSEVAPSDHSTSGYEAARLGPA